MKMTHPTKEMVFLERGRFLSPEPPPVEIEGSYDCVRTWGPIGDYGGGLRCGRSVTDPLVKRTLRGMVRGPNEVIPSLTPPVTFGSDRL